MCARCTCRVPLLLISRVHTGIPVACCFQLFSTNTRRRRTCWTPTLVRHRLRLPDPYTSRCSCMCTCMCAPSSPRTQGCVSAILSIPVTRAPSVVSQPAPSLPPHSCLYVCCRTSSPRTSSNHNRMGLCSPCPCPCLCTPHHARDPTCHRKTCGATGAAGTGRHPECIRASHSLCTAVLYLQGKSLAWTAVALRALIPKERAWERPFQTGADSAARKQPAAPDGPATAWALVAAASCELPSLVDVILSPARTLHLHR